MTEREVLVLCYWNGSIKYGPDGVYYEGSIPKKISVKQKTEFSRLVDGLYLITGFDKQKSKFDIIGRYPVVFSPYLFRYAHLPVVNDSSLKTMLEVPSIHPSINSVELYLEVKPASDGVTDLASCSISLDNHGSSLKRQRTNPPQKADGYLDMNVTHPVVKLEMDDWSEVQGMDSHNGEANADFGNCSTHGALMDVTHPVVKLERDIGLEVQGVDNNNGLIEDNANAGFGNGRTHGDGEMTEKNCGLDRVEHGVNLTAENGSAEKDLNVPGLEVPANACLDKGVGPVGLWVDDHELCVGLCFKDRDELMKAVGWCAIRGRKKCVVKETEKDEYMFECIRWDCNWSLRAARMEEHGLVEITKFIGPHTCCPTNFKVKFAAEEMECLIRVRPTLTIDELNNWWFEKYSYKLETSEMEEAKLEVVKKVYGDWDQSFKELPKLMATLQSSNGLLVDLQYYLFPNPEFASFRSVFWAFPQSIEGFPHCRPLILVDIKNLSGKYPMKLMIASGVDADNCNFPLAFAVTKEVSVDSWRWFLSGIREKVTQRKELCLISSPHPDILAAVNEPDSLWKEPWAYHRFCLDHLCNQFYRVFKISRLKNLVKQAGFARQQDEFDSHMETIKKESPEARRWLDQMSPHQWAFAHDGCRRYGVMSMDRKVLFSMCESFESLDLPLTATTLLLFDEVRSFFLTWRDDSNCRLKCGNVYTKPVIGKLEEFMSASIAYVIMPLDKGVFQVTKPFGKVGWIVRLSEGTCTCGVFQSKKIPCLHALAVCEKLKTNPLRYVDDCYTIERLYKTYTVERFSPVPEVSAWPEASGVPALFPPTKQKTIQKKS